MKQLNKIEIKKLEKLNEQLILVEELIYARAKEENQIVLKKFLTKEHNILDYEIEAEINYISKKNKDDSLIATTTVGMKAEIMCDDQPWGIGYIKDYNFTETYQKDKTLNAQKHCTLMVCLYDFYKYNWKNFFSIDTINFNIKVIYKYKHTLC